MANNVSINVEGIEEVCAALTALPSKLAKNAFTKGLIASAVPVAEAVLARTPEHTGDLKAHLKTDVVIDASGKGGSVQIGFSGKNGSVARWLEYGHREIGHKPLNKDLGSVQPHPFMRPALETAADAAIEAFTESVLESIESGLV
jgi:HK97 gp10 family phage protein